MTRRVIDAVLSALPWIGAAALVAALVAIAGLPRLQASQGHWPITADILHFIARRSIATWSMGVKVPALDDPELLVVGAGHYAAGCEPCHGAPGVKRAAYALAMTPVPPELDDDAARWDPEDLYYVVLHGVKYTGMPAWPAMQREDEVWPVVAFLKVMPELEEVEYRALAHGESLAEVPPVVRSCVRCHGEDGLGRGVYPRLAGLSEEYMAASLMAYLRQERASGIMQTAVDGLDREDVDEVARWFAALPEGPPFPAPPDADLAHGKAVAYGLTGTPSCVACHGVDEPARTEYPELAGQDPEYLRTQLELFQRHDRGGTPFARLMRSVVAHGLDAEDIRDVSAWYATQR